MSRKVPLVLFFVAALSVLTVIGVFVALQRDGHSPRLGRHEISSLPGAVSYTEGQTEEPDLFTQAEAQMERNDYSAAEATYRRIIGREPRNAPGYVGLASCRLCRNDLDGADRQYRIALALDPRSTMALIGLGSVAAWRSDFRAAAGDYRAALAIREDVPDAHWGLALAEEGLNDPTDAVRHFRRFLALAPESALAPQARLEISRLQKQRL